MATDSNPMTLSRKLYLVCGGVVAGLAVLGAVVWALMKQVTAQAADTRDHVAPQLARISEIELNITRASLQLRHAILARTPDERRGAIDDILARKRLVEERLRQFGEGHPGPAAQGGHPPLSQLMSGFWAIGGQNLAHVEAGRKDEAFAFLVDQTIPARNRLLEPLAEEKARLTALLQADLGHVEAAAAKATAAVATAVIATALALLGLTLWLQRVLRGLGAEPDELRRVAHRVAAGDLAAPIALRADDTTSVMHALARMSQQLAGTVRAVRDNAHTVALASTEIAGGNADLSQRTERQAAALQQTASSMEQLGATVARNADNAREVEQLASTASDVAGRGGEMVQQVVDTMRGINDSSRRIADIIGTIDAIAFQTNILALNAAVEAARAGEQGRGFAVVAGEVRSLAQRSAEASREIRTLIQASVERVERGSELVDRAGATMQEVVSRIQRVSSLTAQISSASTEQSAGVRQVGQAIAELDRTTQSNAALVEQGSAAATSLQQQSQQLVQAMAVFKVA